MFTGKRVTVGVSGGIAAYKAADIVSWLNQQGAYVQVVMTKSATEFITPLTMKTLSGHAVAVDIMSTDDAFHVPHIDVADCDLFVIVPATANIMAKARIGLADDMLSASLLATTAPVLCAPAMHTDMYNNSATQENLAILKSRGWSMIEPGFGRLACGRVGQGKLADVDTIKQAITEALQDDQLLAGKKVLISAGPTHEEIDPVRFIANRSSGKMGHAVAQAAVAAGADVTLIMGPSVLPDLAGGQTVRVVSARDMYDAFMERYPKTDIVIMAAAVADYRVANVADQKIKKSGEMDLHLVKNPDILRTMGEHKTHQFLVGFAAETQNVDEYATKKLKEKNLDLMIANNVAKEGAGFDSDTNIVTAFWSDAGGLNREEWPLLSKRETGKRIIEKIAQLLEK